MNFVAVFLAISMLTRFATDANATKKSKTCGTRNWPTCALEKSDIETDDFGVIPTIVSSFEEDDANVVASVKVHHTQCPHLHSPTVKWYMLEAFAADSNVSMGRFIEPVHSRRLETYACHSDSTIVFNTCEPHPLDLPREYGWVTPRGNLNSTDITCFRLTVVDEEEKCRYTESCIELRPPMTSGSGDDDLGVVKFPTSAPGSGVIGESDNLTERCNERWDCTNAKMRLFCGTDGNTYMSRCHIRLAECITDTDISINHAGQCDHTPEPYCHIQRESLQQTYESFPNAQDLWLPTCNCDGLFKPIQCDRDLFNEGQLDCWCSYSNSMSQVAGTRRLIVDTCTDPAAFEFSCSSTWFL